MRFTKNIPAIGILLLFITALLCFSTSHAQPEGYEVPDEVMNRVYNRFACSYDLMHWTDWQGQDLIAPSEPYDELFAHKSYVVKHDGVVYHFYCAVNKKENRGIAVATSVDKGKSKLRFNSKQR